jgi:diguanylate cyclase (GGDEF)-like protein
MRPRAVSILVILDRERSRSRVFGAGRAVGASFTTACWNRLPVASLSSGRFSAVLYPAHRGRGDAAKRNLARLRRLAPGLPLLPFRVDSRGPRRNAARRSPALPGDSPLLTAPFDAWLLRAYLENRQQCLSLRGRARDTALQVRDREAKLRALAAIVRCTGNELDPQRIIAMAMNHVTSFLEMRGWLFYLLDAEQGLLTVEQVGGQGVVGLKGSQIGLGEGVAGRAAQKRHAVLPEESPADGAKVRGAAMRDPHGRTSLAVPLLSRGRAIGVVEVFGSQGPGRFGAEHARLLRLLLEPAAVAVDNALLLKKSEELSITDDLTKLHNSRFLNTMLRREVERCRRYRTPVSLIFLDLDGFKDVNDKHGHLCGSRTLVEVGEVIKGMVREIDVASRYGGDEFTVILPQTGPEGAQIIAERIRQRIEETNFLASYGLRVRITASLGIACFPEHGRTKDDLIARADQAMYQVKGRGKNGVALSEVERPRRLQGRSA